MSYTIDINYLDAPFQEQQHPRKHGGAGAGQFVKKGSEAGGFNAPPAKTVYHVKPIGLIQKAAASGGTPQELISKIQAVTALYKHANVASYANGVIKALEQHIGVPKGSLGTVSSKPGGGGAKAPPIGPKPAWLNNPYTPPPRPPKPPPVNAYTAKPKPVVTPAPKEDWELEAEKAAEEEKNKPPPTPTQAAANVTAQKNKKGLPPAVWEPGGFTPFPIADIGDIYKDDDVGPYVKAARIKLIAKNSGEVHVKQEAALYLKKLEADFGLPPGMLDNQHGLEPEPEPLPAGPIPHPEGGPKQQQIYKLGIDPNTTTKEKIEEIMKVVLGTSGQYTKEFGMEWLKALGYKEPPPSAPQPKPSYVPPPPPAPKPLPAKTVPAKPSKSWQKAQADFLKAARSPSNDWEQTEAMASFGTATKTLKSKLPPDLYKVIHEYTNSASTIINGALRDEYKPDQHTAEQIAAMDDLFEERITQTLKDTVLWRHTHFNDDVVKAWSASLALGLPTRFNCKGFLSTSFKKDRGALGGKFRLEILTRAGTPAVVAQHMSNHKSECEVLLRHGQGFDILEIDNVARSDGYRHIKMVTRGS
jgi:hypothetical protein